MDDKPSTEEALLTKLATEAEIFQNIMDELIELATSALSPNGTPQRSSAAAIVRVTTLQTHIQSWVSRKQSLDKELVDAIADYELALRNSIKKGEQLSRNEVLYLENIKEKDYLLHEKDEQIEAARAGATANAAAREEIRQLKKDKREVSTKLEHVVEKFQHLTSQYDALKAAAAQTGRQQPLTTMMKQKLDRQYDDEVDSSRPQSAKRKRGSKLNSPTLFVDMSSIEDLNISETAESALAARRLKAKSKSQLVDSSRKTPNKSPLIFSSNAAQRRNNEPFRFQFTAIMSYDADDGRVKDSRPSSAFNDSLTLSYVRDRIAVVLRTIWQPELGSTDVCFLEFEADHDAGLIPRCITAVAEHRKTHWRIAAPPSPAAAAGDGIGGVPVVAGDDEPEWKFACMDCVQRGLPCFVVGDGGLKLLPFHPEDRPRKLILPGNEAWYWVNLDKEVKDEELV